MDLETVTSNEPSSKEIIKYYVSDKNYSEPRWEVKKNPKTWSRVTYTTINDGDNITEKTITLKTDATSSFFEDDHGIQYITISKKIPAPSLPDNDNNIKSNSVIFISKTRSDSEYVVEVPDEKKTPPPSSSSSSAKTHILEVINPPERKSHDTSAVESSQQELIYDVGELGMDNMQTMAHTQLQFESSSPRRSTQLDIAKTLTSVASAQAQTMSKWKTSNVMAKPNIYVEERNVNNVTNSHDVIENVPISMEATFLTISTSTASAPTANITTTTTTSTKHSMKHYQDDNEERRAKMEVAIEAVPAKPVIPKVTKLPSNISVSENVATEIQKTPCPSPSLKSLQSPVGGTRPTWIIRRQHTENTQDINSGTTASIETNYETPTEPILSRKPAKIDNWAIANAKRVEENRKLSKGCNQIPHKSPTASISFKETIEGYERIIGMQQFPQHKGTGKTSKKWMSEEGSMTNDTLLSDQKNIEIGGMPEKDDSQIEENSFNKAFEKFTQAIRAQQQAIARKPSKHSSRRSKSTIERHQSTRPIRNAHDDNIQKKATIRGSLALDYSQKHATVEEKQRQSKDTSHQTETVRNISEGQPVAPSRITKRITYKTIETTEERDAATGQVLSVRTRTLSEGSFDQQEEEEIYSVSKVSTDTSHNAFANYQRSIGNKYNQVDGGRNSNAIYSRMLEDQSTHLYSNRAQAATNELNINKSAALESEELEKRKIAEFDLPKDTFQKAFASYQQAVAQQQPVKTHQQRISKLIGNQILMQNTSNNSGGARRQWNSMETNSARNSIKSDTEKNEMHDIFVGQNTPNKDPSITVFSYDKWQNDQTGAANENGNNGKGTVIIRTESSDLGNIAAKPSFQSRRPIPFDITTATVAPDVKQAAIRTQLSQELNNDDDDDDDDFDPFDEVEYQPDWVTSSFRLGSIRRRKSKKSAAMQRIQKEIDLERQRRSEMTKMKQNDIK